MKKILYILTTVFLISVLSSCTNNQNFRPGEWNQYRLNDSDTLFIGSQNSNVYAVPLKDFENN